MTIALIVLICVFASMKVEMLNKEYVEAAGPLNFMTTTKRRAYLPTDTFSYENGLNMAVAFTAYDNEEIYTLDLSYGEIIFKAQTWGEDADGNVSSNHENIESTVCTDE